MKINMVINIWGKESMKNLIIMLSLFLAAVPTNAVEETDLQQELGGEVILKPQMKISQEVVAKHTIKLEYLMPYLENIMFVENPALQKNKGKLGTKTKKVVSPRKDLNIDSKTSRYVVGFEKKSIKMAGSKERVFVSGLATDQHYSYVLVNPKFSYYHPDTGEYLGTEIFVIGKAKIVRRGVLSLLNIESAKEPIKPGTLVLPSRSLKLSDSIKTIAPAKELKGYVLSVMAGINSAAANSVVILSLGERDGAEVGQLLQIKQVDLVIKDPYESKKTYNIKLDKPKGEVMIYDVFDKLSLGIIIKSSEEVKLLDRVVSG